MALSIALRESADANETGFKAHFLEKRGYFAWHPALLLPGSQLQVSPLKDLVTLRDPTSTYSFFNYLHSHGRLARYINKEQSVPSRREWTSYLAWAARRMNDDVSYGQDVLSIEPFTLASAAPDAKQNTVAVRPASGEETDSLCLYRVRVRDEATGRTVDKYTRNLSVAVGGVPSFHQHLKLPMLNRPTLPPFLASSIRVPLSLARASGAIAPSDCLSSSSACW